MEKRFHFALSLLETICIVRWPSLTQGTVVVILMLLSCRELRGLDLNFSMFTERDCGEKICLTSGSSFFPAQYLCCCTRVTVRRIVKSSFSGKMRLNTGYNILQLLCALQSICFLSAVLRAQPPSDTNDFTLKGPLLLWA